MKIIPLHSVLLPLLTLAASLVSISCRQKDAGAETPSVSMPQVDLASLDPAIAHIIRQGQALVRKDPEIGESWGILGSIYFAHEFRPQARECLGKAESLEPTEPRWPYLKAIALLHSDADAGLTSMQRAVELTGNSPSAPKLFLAQLLIERGSLEEAETLARQILELEPRNPRALLCLGRIFFARNELEKSYEHLKRSVLLFPDARSARVLLTTVAERLGKPDPGASLQPTVEELPASYPWPDQYREEANGLRRGREAEIERARVMLEEGRPDEAAKLLDKVTESYPDAEQAWWMLGLASQQQGRPVIAEKAYRKAVELDPKSFDARSRFGTFLLFEKNDLAAAEEQLEAARDLQPRSALAALNLALCDTEQGDLDGAISGYRRAVEINPAFVPAHLGLAAVLWRKGIPSEARTHLQKARNLDPNHPQIEALSRHFEVTPAGSQ